MRAGNVSKADSKSIVVGLGDGLSVTLCGGESAVDPRRRSCHVESGTNTGHGEGTATSTDGCTVGGDTVCGSIRSASLWMKLHLNNKDTINIHLLSP